MFILIKTIITALIKILPLERPIVIKTIILITIVAFKNTSIRKRK